MNPADGDVRAILHTLGTVALAGCERGEAQAYVKDMADNAGERLRRLMQDVRAVIATGDERTLRIAIDNLRASYMAARGAE